MLKQPNQSVSLVKVIVVPHPYIASRYIYISMPRNALLPKTASTYLHV